MELSLKIGRRINEVRGSISQAAFSKRLNVTQSTIGRYERGIRSPDAEFILLLKEHYNINPNWLITGIEPKFMQNGLLAPMHNDTEEQAGSENSSLTVIEHIDLIKKFQDKETGKEFNSILLKLEKLSPKEYYSLLGYAKRTLTELTESDTQEKKVSGTQRQKNGTEDE